MDHSSNEETSVKTVHSSEEILVKTVMRSPSEQSGSAQEESMPTVESNAESQTIPKVVPDSGHGGKYFL